MALPDAMNEKSYLIAFIIPLKTFLVDVRVLSIEEKKIYIKKTCTFM